MAGCILVSAGLFVCCEFSFWPLYTRCCSSYSDMQLDKSSCTGTCALVLEAKAVDTGTQVCVCVCVFDIRLCTSCWIHRLGLVLGTCAGCLAVKRGINLHSRQRLTCSHALKTVCVVQKCIGWCVHQQHSLKYINKCRSVLDDVCISSIHCNTSTAFVRYCAT